MDKYDVIPKRERSPTPILTTRPKTEGSWLVSPVPEECTKLNSNSQAARKKWVESEAKKLIAKGLRIQKAFIREDGLVLDWTSKFLVWPDTLQLANTSWDNLLVRQDTSAEDTNITQSSDFQPFIEAPSISDTSNISMQNTGDDIEKQATELEDKAIDYLKRYVEAFDTRRDSLEGAYSANALLSYCIHDIVTLSPGAAASMKPAEIQRFAHRSRSRNLEKANNSKNISCGLSEIMTTLQSFGRHKFCPGSPVDLAFNVLALKVGQKPCVYISSHGYLTNEHDKLARTISYDQSFILMRREDTETSTSSRDDSNLWPLVATNHQLTVRDLSLVPETMTIS